MLRAPEAKEVIAVPALKQIDELALKLGDESFVVREQAMVDLWKLGGRHAAGFAPDRGG